MAERRKDVSRTVVAHRTGEEAGQRLKPRAFLAGNPKGLLAGCPQRDGAFHPSCPFSGSLRTKERRAGLLLCPG